VNKIEIVKKAFNFDTPRDEAEGYLSDDYQWSDSMGNPPMNKAAWLGFGYLLRASIPDMGYTIEEIHQEGDDVVQTGYFTGTFKKDLDLSAMNMGVIPATGKALKFPSSTSRVSFTGDKISKNHDLTTDPTAGMAGFLAVLKGG
jgi:predicted ester cyclase